MSLYTTEEAEMLIMLANNVALAFDNADAYTKLQEFSVSLNSLLMSEPRRLSRAVKSLGPSEDLLPGVAHELNNPLRRHEHY